MSEIEIHGGTDIAWPRLDVDHYLVHLLAGQYGSSKWMRQLELKGLPDTPLNSPSAIARIRTADASYSLFQPSSHIEHQILSSVTQTPNEFGMFTGLDLHFESKALRLAALAHNETVEMTIVDEPHSGRLLLLRYGRVLSAKGLTTSGLPVDQQGNLDTVLLGFSSVVIPDVAITTVASELRVRRVVD